MSAQEWIPGVDVAVRRGGRWPLIRAAAAVGVSHRTARTVATRYQMRFPAGTRDLLTLRVLAEVLLFTPPPQSEKRSSEVFTRQRDATIVGLAEQVWDGRMHAAHIIVAPHLAILAPNVRIVGTLMAELDTTQTVTVLPAGAWARQIADRIVD